MGRKILSGMAVVSGAVAGSGELDLVALLEGHDGLLVIRGRGWAGRWRLRLVLPRTFWMFTR